MEQSQNIPEKGKHAGGNPAWVKGGPSPHPQGKPKGIPSAAGEIKEGFFHVYLAAGGADRLIKLLKTSKRADELFKEFCFKVLPSIFPKRTEMDIEHRSVTFIFGDGSQETFKSSEALGGVIDIEEEPKSQE
jgi:hypothetical protein